ncbi:MAG: alpha/beta fold hydrolase [Gemmatimonadota bacterium]|nr:MAG: alpha/beta fold hydrolase [Gemmatimonadota bacterium]
MAKPTLLAAITCVVIGCAAEHSERASEEGLRLINSTELYVKRIGSGEPIVVVHGGPMLDHGYLLPHLQPLAQSYQLTFFDQRLSGRSAPQVDSASVRIATFVEDIEQLRLSLGLERIHLMGHSWGGLLAMHYAIKYPQSLRSLILLNSMSASSAIWQEEERVLARQITAADSIERETIRETDAYARRDPEAIARLLRLSFRLQFRDTSRVNDLRLYVPADYAERSRQFGYMMVDLADFDLHDQLTAVTVPTLTLYGSHEPAAQLSGPLLHQQLPNSELVILDEAGHFPFIEQPEAFFDAVSGFLDRASGQ